MFSRMNEYQARIYTLNWTEGEIRRTTSEFSENKVNILFTGDLSPRGSLERQILEEKHDHILGQLKIILKEHNFVVANLETVLTNRQEKIIKDGPNLKSNPDCIKSLKKMGINVYCLANNHILDYGEKGLNDTIKTLKENDLFYTGLYPTQKEAEYLTLVYNGVKIGIFNFAEAEESKYVNGFLGALDISNKNIDGIIKTMIEETDYSIVVFHGSREYIISLPPYIRKIVSNISKLGVDLIICHHPHVPQGIEIINKTIVFYSLGNFIFKMPKKLIKKNPSLLIGYLVSIEVSKNGLTNAKMIPYRTKDDGSLELLKKDKKLAFMNFIKEISSLASYEQLNHEYWVNYVNKLRRKSYIPYLCSAFLNTTSEDSFFLFIKNIFMVFLRALIMRRKINKERARALNHLTTKSHFEFILSALKGDEDYSRSQKKGKDIDKIIAKILK